MSCFVISELGINHNGDLNLAKRMIDESILAGADAVKFQKRDIDLVYSKDFLKEKKILDIEKLVAKKLRAHIKI